MNEPLKEISIGFENLLDLLDVIVSTGMKDMILSVLDVTKKMKDGEAKKSEIVMGFDLICGVIKGLATQAKDDPELIYGFFGRCYVEPVSWQEMKRAPIREVIRLVSHIQKEVGDARSFFGLLSQKPQGI